MRLGLFCGVLALVLLGGCAPAPDLPQERGSEPALFFCKQDDCAGQLASLIRSAQKTVHCAFYDLDLEGVVGALGQKSATAQVRVVIDRDNDLGLLRGEGVRFDTRHELMHNKFCVVDGMYVWTGSFNPTERGNAANENHAILLSSHYLAKNYEEEFSELWEGSFGNGSEVAYPMIKHNGYLLENYFCPEDGCEERVVGLLSGAEESILVLVFSFTSETVADALLFNLNATTKGIFDSSQAGGRYSQFDRLKGFGLDVRTDEVPGKFHHKVLVIDNETVITGSYNPTRSGAFSNDENILVLHHEKTARRFAKYHASLER